MGFARNAGSPPSVNYLIGKKINDESQVPFLFFLFE
jgi:hypothetical protein